VLIVPAASKSERRLKLVLDATTDGPRELVRVANQVFAAALRDHAIDLCTAYEDVNVYPGLTVRDRIKQWAAKVAQNVCVVACAVRT
jgi:hypothetical protein